jgi:hypothetical protein
MPTLARPLRCMNRLTFAIAGGATVTVTGSAT